VDEVQRSGWQVLAFCWMPNHIHVLLRTPEANLEQILQVVATAHQVAPEEYVGFRSAAAGREMAAWLCRRWTGVSLAELSRRFGLRHPDSSANLVRRAKQREADSAA
jgi:putative transposase